MEMELVVQSITDLFYMKSVCETFQYYPTLQFYYPNQNMENEWTIWFRFLFPLNEGFHYTYQHSTTKEPHRLQNIHHYFNQIIEKNMIIKSIPQPTENITKKRIIIIMDDGMIPDFIYEKMRDEKYQEYEIVVYGYKSIPIYFENFIDKRLSHNHNHNHNQFLTNLPFIKEFIELITSKNNITISWNNQQLNRNNISILHILHLLYTKPIISNNNQTNTFTQSSTIFFINQIQQQTTTSNILIKPHNKLIFEEDVKQEEKQKEEQKEKSIEEAKRRWKEQFEKEQKQRQPQQPQQSPHLHQSPENQISLSSNFGQRSYPKVVSIIKKDRNSLELEEPQEHSEPIQSVISLSSNFDEYDEEYILPLDEYLFFALSYLMVFEEFKRKIKKIWIPRMRLSALEQIQPGFHNFINLVLEKMKSIPNKQFPVFITNQEIENRDIKQFEVKGDIPKRNDKYEEWKSWIGINKMECENPIFYLVFDGIQEREFDLLKKKKMTKYVILKNNNLNSLLLDEMKKIKTMDVLDYRFLHQYHGYVYENYLENLTMEISFIEKSQRIIGFNNNNNNNNNNRKGYYDFLINFK